MSARRRRWLAVGAIAVLALAAGSFALAQALRYAHEPVRIAIDATPIAAFDVRDPSQVRFGALEFRGGLVLTSKSDAFGGISGLRVEPDGSHFLAVTDHGSWLRARIVYGSDGKPAGIADAELAPILGADGKPLAARGWFDVEALTELDGLFYVGIERVQQIVRFDYRKDGLAARGEPIAVPAEFAALPANKSLECLAAGPKNSPLAGKLIAVTERSLDAAGNLRAFMLKGDQVERFSVLRSNDFEVSDCLVLGANLLLLERSYSPLKGVAMRIRRVPLAALKDGAVVDGEPLIVADLGYQIDNMEGLAAHRNASGEIILTLVSDDNFSIIQRNLLLQFALVRE